jgi:hypothetical protein
MLDYSDFSSTHIAFLMRILFYFPSATRVTALWLMRVKNRSTDVIGHIPLNLLPNQPQSG